METDDTPSGKARQLRSLSAELDESLEQSQALSMRLAALVELGLDLAAERDVSKMLEMFCHAARDIMSAQLAVVCILNEDGSLQQLETWGMSATQSKQVRMQFDPAAGALGELRRSGRAIKLNKATDSWGSLGIPAAHPPMKSFLAVPLKSSSRSYGWFYVADRLASEDFHENDEQLALMLASQLIPHYENLVLLDRLQRHAGILNIETEERKNALHRLQESELRFRQLAENIREVFFLLEAKSGDMLYVSPAYEEIWERSTESLYTHPQSWLDAIHPDDHAMAVENFVASRETGRFDFEYRLLTSDDTVRWIKARGFPIFNADGEIYRIAGLAEDITESKIQALKIQRLSRIYAVLSGINSAIVRIHEHQGLLEEACRIAVEHGGFPMAWIGLVNADDNRIRVSAYAGIKDELAGKLASYFMDESISQKGGAVDALQIGKPVITNVIRPDPGVGPVLKEAIHQGFGSMIALPLMIEDIPAGVMVLFARERDFFDEQELALLDELAGDVAFALRYIAREEKLHYLAYYDSLTGLANDSLFQERLSQMIAQHPKENAALFLIDLDRFTQLNDTLGRHVGDKLLANVGRRLQAQIPERGSLARISSDTFAVMVPSLHQETEAGSVLQDTIFAALQRPLIVEEQEIRISARVGIAVYPRDGRDYQTLFNNAEAALKESKASGARYLFYSPDLNSRIADDLALEQELLRAVEEQQFVVHYQPKIDSRTGAVCGLEALVRWDSPESGLVSPARFIPALEESELILDVGRWVLERALADHRRWRDKGILAPRVSVNVSPIQLRYDDFSDMVVKSIEQLDQGGAALDLEITESVIMADLESNNDRLQRISERGVTITIDDFGTGYSSLRYLAKLPVNALKIDRSFIDNMATDADDMTIVSTIIALAHSFDLEVVAEGVETEEQAELLRLMKCDSMQGFLFAKPMPAEEIESFLSKHKL
jgi:diguanylate cyclase (GGDEF)-like protein/PAS domain S-box-containing protein